MRELLGPPAGHLGQAYDAVMRLRVAAWGPVLGAALLIAGCSSTPTAAGDGALGNTSTTYGASKPGLNPPTTSAPVTVPPTTVPPTTVPPTTVPPTTVPPTVVPPTVVPATSGIVVGPGPQSTYTVESQPAPGSCHYRFQGADPLPDPSCTPGATNPDVTQATLAATICRSGYTSSIRPSSSITGAEKVGSAAAYGYTGSFHTGEYDHLISLELGGDPNDPRNLWVEPNDRPDASSTYNTKDRLENRLNDLICSGQLSLVDAQQAIATNWVAALARYGI